MQKYMWWLPEYQSVGYVGRCLLLSTLLYSLTCSACRTSFDLYLTMHLSTSAGWFPYLFHDR